MTTSNITSQVEFKKLVANGIVVLAGFLLFRSDILFSIVQKTIAQSTPSSLDVLLSIAVITILSLFAIVMVVSTLYLYYHVYQTKGEQATYRLLQLGGFLAWLFFLFGIVTTRQELQGISALWRFSGFPDDTLFRTFGLTILGFSASYTILLYPDNTSIPRPLNVLLRSTSGVVIDVLSAALATLIAIITIVAGVTLIVHREWGGITLFRAVCLIQVSLTTSIYVAFSLYFRKKYKLDDTKYRRIINWVLSTIFGVCMSILLLAFAYEGLLQAGRDNDLPRLHQFMTIPGAWDFPGMFQLLQLAATKMLSIFWHDTYYQSNDLPLVTTRMFDWASAYYHMFRAGLLIPATFTLWRTSLVEFSLFPFLEAVHSQISPTTHVGKAED